MNFSKNTQRGSLKWIIIAVVGLVLASYFFNFSVQDAVEDEQTQANFGYISTNARALWDNHLATTAHYLWDDIFIDLIWEAFTENLQRLKDGEQTIFEQSAPGVSIINTTADVTNDPLQPLEINFIGDSINDALREIE